MKKLEIIALSLFFLVGMSAGTALAYTATSPEVWWAVYDTSQLSVDNPVAPDDYATEVTLDPTGDTLYLYLFASGIPDIDGDGLDQFDIDVAWSDDMFGSPDIHISDTYWATMQNEQTGPPFHGDAAQDFMSGASTWSGDNIPLFAIELTTDGLTAAYELIATVNALHRIDGEDFASSVTVHNLTANPIPIPSAIVLLSSGLLGLVGIRRRGLSAS
jgi:hypothetical protein